MFPTRKICTPLGSRGRNSTTQRKSYRKACELPGSSAHGGIMRLNPSLTSGNTRSLESENYKLERIQRHGHDCIPNRAATFRAPSLSRENTSTTAKLKGIHGDDAVSAAQRMEGFENELGAEVSHAALHPSSAPSMAYTSSDAGITGFDVHRVYSILVEAGARNRTVRDETTARRVLPRVKYTQDCRRNADLVIPNLHRWHLGADERVKDKVDGHTSSSQMEVGGAFFSYRTPSAAPLGGSSMPVLVSSGVMDGLTSHSSQGKWPPPTYDASPSSLDEAPKIPPLQPLDARGLAATKASSYVGPTAMSKLVRVSKVAAKSMQLLSAVQANKLTEGLGTWADDTLAVGRMLEDERLDVASDLEGARRCEKQMRRRLEAGVDKFMKTLPLGLLKHEGCLDGAQFRGLEIAERVLGEQWIKARAFAWDR